jgi:FkbM family methyltransferase
MKRNTRLVSIKNTPMVIYEGPECISDDIVKYNNFWEFELFDYFKHWFPKEGLMLDIGANIGAHCVQFKHYFPNLKIWAFEPFFENYNILKTNTDRYNDVHCFNLGVGSNNSMVHFGNEQEQNSGVIKIVPKSNITNLVIALDTITFPEPVKFIKIDVEGHELSAFEGMTDLLLKYKPTIWLEDNSKTAVPYLEKLGYKIIQKQISTNDYLMI